ncbi:MAG TPA: class I SAM-dependent methyltransferase [Burkholderiales bacterium]|nr:class I SAM-dependent methyltransferase [Burkholderiales bacterium]
MKRCLRCEARYDAPGWRCPACGLEPEAVQAGDIRYDASRFEVLARLEGEHFWFSARTRLIVWALRRHFPQAQSLLEVGCGTGNVLGAIGEAAPALHLTGSEAHASALAFARSRVPGAMLLQMDARRIPYRDEFDVVGAFDVLEHIEEDDRVLREMFESCRSGGGAIITVPQHPWLWSYRDEFAHHVRRYRRAELLRKVRAAGFERIWASSFVTALLPLMAWSRLRQKSPRGFDTSSELRVGRAANRVLGAVMALERRLLRAGLTLPAGGSLLVVAHKP